MSKSEGSISPNWPGRELDTASTVESTHPDWLKKSGWIRYSSCNVPSRQVPEETVYGIRTFKNLQPFLDSLREHSIECHIVFGHSGIHIDIKILNSYMLLVVQSC